MSIETLLEAAKFVELSDNVDKFETSAICASGFEDGIESSKRTFRQTEASASGECSKTVPPPSPVQTPTCTVPKHIQEYEEKYPPLQPPSASLQPPPTSLQPPPTSLHPPPTSLQPPPTSLHPPPTSLHPPPTSLHPPPTSIHPPPTSIHSPKQAAPEVAQSFSRPVWHQVDPVDIKNKSLNGKQKLYHDLEVAIHHPGYDVRWTFCSASSHGTHTSPSFSSPMMGSGLESKMLGSSDDFSPLGESSFDSDELVSDDKRAEIRQVHNKLEKNRRAHLKECFDGVKSQIPTLQDRKVKTSNLSILRGALRFIQALKRKEKELEHELDRLVREKIEKQRWLNRLRMKHGISDDVELPWLQEEEDIVIKDSGSGGCTQATKNAEELKIATEEAYFNDLEVADEHDSTSTASEGEEEEMGLEGGPKKMNTSTSDSTCDSLSSGTLFSSKVSSPPLSGSYRHPLKSHLLREHRLQMAREAAHSGEKTSGAVSTSNTLTVSSSPIASSSIQHVSDKALTSPPVALVPNVPGSPAMRPTVSQLLGKHNIVIRQPVRKQTPVHSPPNVFQSVTSVQRYQTPIATVQLRPHREIAVRPSATHPVVTIGLTQALQSHTIYSQANLQGHTTIRPSLTLTSNVPLSTNKNISAQTIPVVTSVLGNVDSLGGSFLQPRVQNFIPHTLTLPPTATQVLLAQPSLAGYPSLGHHTLLSSALSSTLLQQVDPASLTPLGVTVPHLTPASIPSSTLSSALPRNTPHLYLSGTNVNIPIMSIENRKLPVVAPLVGNSGDATAISVNKSLFNALPLNSINNSLQSSKGPQIQTVSNAGPAVPSSVQRTVAMVSLSSASATKRLKSSRDKLHRKKRSSKLKNGTLITTSMIAETLLTNRFSNGKTVTAGQTTNTKTVQSVEIKR